MTNKVGILRLQSFSPRTILQEPQMREKVYEGVSLAIIGKPAPTPGIRRNRYRAKHNATTSPAR